MCQKNYNINRKENKYTHINYIKHYERNVIMTKSFIIHFLICMIYIKGKRVVKYKIKSKNLCILIQSFH